MSYSTEHAGALGDIRTAGAPVTFTKTTLGAYDPETDTATPSTTSVGGHAVRVRGRPDTYDALQLVESQAPTLLFAATTFGQAPALGATVTWGGETYTVRDVNPVAPDGSGIIFRVVVAQ